MTTTTLAASSTTSRSASTSSSPASTLRAKAAVAAAILVAFSAYSFWVIAGYGYTGFLSLAAREPWAMQLLLDLVIACSFGIGWLVPDARRRGIAAWPYIVLVLFAGSIGLLAYVVRRGFAAK